MFYCLGKSLASFAALRYLSKTYEKTILYVPLKSASEEATANKVAVLWRDMVFSATLLSSTSTIQDLFLMVDALMVVLKLNSIFIDGYHDGVKIAPRLHEIYQKRGISPVFVEYLAMTTSMMPQSGLFGIDSGSPWMAKAWELADYFNMVDSGIVLTEQQLENIASTENTTIAAGKDAVKAAIRKKFLVAGYSCRFMLDYSVKKVISVLYQACDRAEKSLASIAETSHRIVNTLVVTVGQRLIPVSALAAALIAYYKFNPQVTTPIDFQNVIRAIQSKNMSFLGWFFEQEVLDRLKSWLIVPVGSAVTAVGNVKSCVSADFAAIRGTSTPDVIAASSTPAAAASLDPAKPAALEGLVGKLSIEVSIPHQQQSEPTGGDAFSPFPSVLEDSLQSFELMVCNRGTDTRYAFPQDCEIVLFKDYKGIVEELVVREHSKRFGPVVFIPMDCANPFFDYALVQWRQGPKKMKVEMTTYQITVSATHSCNVTIVQAISNGLALRKIKMSEVIHHAVLPSRDAARSFTFADGIAMAGRTSYPRASKKRKIISNQANFADVFEGAEIMYDGEDNDVDEYVVEIEKAGSNFMWTTVSVGDNLYIVDSYLEIAKRVVIG